MTPVVRDRRVSPATAILAAAALVSLLGAGGSHWRRCQLDQQLARLAERRRTLAAESTRSRRPPAAPINAPQIEPALPGAPGSVTRARPRLAEAAPLTWVSARALRGSGRDTPLACFESVVAAADGGDLDALANLITLSPVDRAQAEAFLARLTRKERQAFGTPERLMALMIARDAPTQVELYSSTTNPESGTAEVCALSEDASGTPHLLWYSFSPSADGWHLGRINPPASTFSSYLQEITGETPLPAAPSPGEHPPPTLPELPRRG